MESGASLLEEQNVNMSAAAKATGLSAASLFEAYYAVVYRTALRITGAAVDAEDVLQTVFLRLAERGVADVTPGREQAYLRRAAANAAIDILRRRARRDEVQLAAITDRAAHTPELLLKERLRRAIATLDPEDAALFLLRYVEGLENGELAELLRQEKNNIAVRLHRIRQTLQREMER